MRKDANIDKIHYYCEGKKKCIRYILGLCGHKIKLTKIIVGCEGTSRTLGILWQCPAWIHLWNLWSP